VLHSADLLGALTERWIQLQADYHHDFDSRLLGAVRAPAVERRIDWLVASDRMDLRLLHAGMFKSGGYSLALLGRVFRANPPAVIHAHYGIFAAQHRHLARSLRCPLVASFYGYDATEDRYVNGRVWRARYRRLFRDVAAVFAEGPAMAGRVAALGCPEEKLRVVRLPADAAGLAGLVRQAPETFLVVAAGRFVEKKGFDTAIKAFARAFRGSDARLLMVGGGPLETELRQLADDEKIALQVSWLGALPFAEFMSAIARASVAVFPSRPAANGDSEGGAPVTLIETQWLGLPVLVSDHDDLPYVAAPEGSIVLPPTDIAAWADGLRALYESPSLLTTMGDAGSTFVRAKHSPEGNAQAREAVYRELSQ
jgi:colanic acid/amylovoran/stewartan biosynthesis glycosyltransferase WcaL/AmsK/CpsK